MALSSEDVIKFMEGKVTEPCPRCKSKSWVVSDTPSTLAGMWIADEDGEFSLNSGIIRMVIVFCKNCGFAAPHVEQVIEAWLKTEGGSDGV